MRNRLQFSGPCRGVLTPIQCSGVDSGGGRIPLNFSNTFGSGIRPSGGESSSSAARAVSCGPRLRRRRHAFANPGQLSRRGRRHRRLLCPEAGRTVLSGPSRRRAGLEGGQSLVHSRQRAGPLSRRTERLRSRPQLRLTFTKPSRRCCRRGGRFRLTTALSEHGYSFVDARSWSS
jgi:hypothetical protein